MSRDYGVQILWSDEDNAYIAATFELPGAVADGSTPEEALANLRIIIEEWISVAKEDGRAIPKPCTCADIEKHHSEFQKQLQQHIRKEIQGAVQRVLNQLAVVQPPNIFREGSYFVRGFGTEFEPAGRSRR